MQNADEMPFVLQENIKQNVIVLMVTEAILTVQMLDVYVLNLMYVNMMVNVVIIKRVDKQIEESWTVSMSVSTQFVVLMPLALQSITLDIATVYLTITVILIMLSTDVVIVNQTNANMITIVANKPMSANH